MKKTLLITLSILIFTACGSSSKSSYSSDKPTDKSIILKLKEKDFIVIAHNISLSRCKLSSTKDSIDGATFGNILEFTQNINKSTVIVSAEKTNVTCEKYDREDNEIGCTIIDFEENTKKSCVAGFDFRN